MYVPFSSERKNVTNKTVHMMSCCHTENNTDGNFRERRKLWTSSSDTILLNQAENAVKSSLLPKAWYVPHPGVFSMEICRRL